MYHPVILKLEVQTWSHGATADVVRTQSFYRPVGESSFSSLFQLLEDACMSPFRPPLSIFSSRSGASPPSLWPLTHHFILFSLTLMLPPLRRILMLTPGHLNNPGTISPSQVLNLITCASHLLCKETDSQIPEIKMLIS